jgi:hypothetical protein
MDFTRKNALISAQNTLTLAEGMRRFMKEHRLSRTDLASIMRTAPRTVNHWLDGDVEPPGIVRAVLDLLEECSCARRALGVNATHTGAHRGQALTRGVPWTGQPRDEMLRRVRAI